MKIEIGTVTYLPSCLGGFCINVDQEEDFIAQNDAEDKLKSLTEIHLTQTKWKMFNHPLN